MALDPLFAQIAAAGLSLLFAAAALHKLQDFEVFVATVQAYRLAPDQAARVVAPLVVLAELAAAGALFGALLGGPPAPGALLAAGLLGAYGGGVWLNLARGRDQIDCGCHFGRGAGALSYALVWRNAVLCALALSLLAPLGARSWTWLDGVATGFGLLAAAALYLAAEAMIRNARLWGWSRT